MPGVSNFALWSNKLNLPCLRVQSLARGYPEPLMSALGQKQTLGKAGLMSALPQKRTLVEPVGMSALCQKQTLANSS